MHAKSVRHARRDAACGPGSLNSRRSGARNISASCFGGATVALARAGAAVAAEKQGERLASAVNRSPSSLNVPGHFLVNHCHRRLSAGRLPDGLSHSGRGEGAENGRNARVQGVLGLELAEAKVVNSWAEKD
jgi:hypothetical protein